jgi:single-strand DNA-binding protein
MNELINECQFIGRFGKDPEMKYTPKGKSILNFSIAIDMLKKVDENYETEATWVDLTAFDKNAEYLTRLCQKGTQVLIRAVYKKNKYQDKEGKNRIGHNFIVRKFYILSGMKQNGSKSKAVSSQDYDDDDDGYSTHDLEMPF